MILEHGKPIVFGKDRKKGIRLVGWKPEVVDLSAASDTTGLLVHDEKAESGTLAYLLAHLMEPEFPVPLGVFRAIERPTYEGLLTQQVKEAVGKPGAGNLDSLIRSGDTWTVD